MNSDVGPVKKILCGETSPLGEIAERLVGKVSECWCCSFWRGALWGAIAGALTASVFAYFWS